MTSGFSLARVLAALLLHVWMKILLGRTLIDCEAALATMDRISGRGFLDYFRRSSQPLLHVPLAVLALFVFDCANSLPGQKCAILAGRLSSGLDRFRLNACQVSFDHRMTSDDYFERLYYGTLELLVNHPSRRFLERQRV